MFMYMQWPRPRQTLPHRWPEPAGRQRLALAPDPGPLVIDNEGLAPIGLRSHPSSYRLYQVLHHLVRPPFFIFFLPGLDNVAPGVGERELGDHLEPALIIRE